MFRRNESELNRDAFLETLSFLIVSYFCISTEIRFILTLKEEIKGGKPFEPEVKTKESEHWHAKSLELACSFLPSDCPLLNHVLLSYQKHHAPSQTAIPENSTTQESLEVVKPCPGIDNCKFQPIIKKVKGIEVELSPTHIRCIKPKLDKLLSEIEPVDTQSITDPILLR